VSGYSVQDFQRTPSLVRDIILREDREIWDAHRHSPTLSDHPTDIQFRIQTRDGQKRWIEHVCQPVKSKHGNLMGVRASNRDITDRKQAEIEAQKHREQLTHISRVTTLGEFSASLAHELNQPLTAIRTNANAALRFLSKEHQNLDEVDEILNDIIEDDKRAAGIIKKLRTLMSKKDLVFSSLNINAVIHEVAKLANREAYTRDIALSMELEDDLPQVRGDAIHLEQVILNLILNGAEAMASCDPSNRKFVIRTAKHDDNVVKVSAKDMGPGIDQKHLGQIFEAFYTTKSTGMGIGLSICRSIVEAHGGMLWAENNSDRGATVSFTVPLSNGDEV
jgi:PAS domain S-box-containing protein